MDWITGLQRAIDYVEEHITEPIDYEEAAKRAYSSSFHFQRVFSTICGYSLGDYIWFRRLSLAGSELAHKDAKVIDTNPNNIFDKCIAVIQDLKYTKYDCAPNYGNLLASLLPNGISERS